MRPKSEIEDGKILVSFSQLDLPKTGLIVASPTILADTVHILWQTILLLDKVLLLKAVFNWVQRLQRVQYLAQALAAVRTRNMPTGSNVQREQRTERKLALVAELNRPLSFHLESQKSEYGIQPNAALDLMISPEEFQQLEQYSMPFLATEDVFVAACMFLRVKISKDRSMFFIAGESPDFRDSIRDRQPIIVEDAAKNISHSLSRPDRARGKVEMNSINSAFNNLVKLNRYYARVKAVAAYLNEDVARTKKDAMQFFCITNTEFERIMKLARREGIVTWRVKRRTPNQYPINASNQEFLTGYAERMQMTEGRALNDIIARFARFSYLQGEQHKRQSLPAKTLEQFRKKEQSRRQGTSTEDSPKQANIDVLS
ncbi:MAG: hypothetical protein FWF12_06965 [Betaproteobacteria bacterium]|nr:hypothetical protein [Betaproteobacteria bacterium]